MVRRYRRPGGRVSRVLLVGKGAPDRGGIAAFLQTLLDDRGATGHEVDYLNLAHTGTPEGGRFSLGNLRRTAWDAVRVWRRAHGCDVVHIHSAPSSTVTLLRASLLSIAARSRGAAVLLHVHGGGIVHWLGNARRRRLVALAMRPANQVVAVWAAGEALLASALGPGRVRLVDNGVRVEAHPEPEPSHEPPRVLYVGLLTPRKGVLDLLAASRLLRARGVEHELWLLGGTPDEGPSAEDEVRRALDPQVRLLGTRRPDEMPAAYAQADVFCLASWWEAMSLSVLEAMAGGLPVVATDVGDSSRIVLDGETGRVVRPHCPEELADALEPLLKDVDLRRRMGAVGRARVREHFSSRSTVDAVSALYTELGRRR